MSAEVRQLFDRPEAYEAAWDRYQAMAKRIQDEPEVLSDRHFMEELWAAERECKRLAAALGVGEAS